MALPDRPFPPTVTTEQAQAIVQFSAPNGAQWKVFEMLDPRPSGGMTLIFSSDEGFRRVREFPTDWPSLDERSLWELSWGR